MSGILSGPSEQTTTQEWKPGPWVLPFLESQTPGLLGTFQQYRDNPQSMVYQGTRVAGPNDTQLHYGTELGQYVDNNPFAAGLMNQYEGTMRGDFAQHAEYNPYESQSNPYTGALNPYSGDSPMFANMLRQGQEDIGNQFARSTAPQMAAAQAMAGAFGSPTAIEAQGVAQRNLADSLARYTSGLQNDQYNRSAQISATDLARNSQLAEGTINRSANLRENQIARENANYDAERQRQMQMAGLFPAFNQAALSNFDAALGFGDFLQSNQQRWYDSQRDYFNEMAGAPMNAANQYINALGALGGLGRAGVATSAPGGK